MGTELTETLENLIGFVITGGYRKDPERLKRENGQFR